MDLASDVRRRWTPVNLLVILMTIACFTLLNVNFADNFHFFANEGDLIDPLFYCLSENGFGGQILNREYLDSCSPIIQDSRP